MTYPSTQWGQLEAKFAVKNLSLSEPWKKTFIAIVWDMPYTPSN